MRRTIFSLLLVALVALPGAAAAAPSTGSGSGSQAPDFGQNYMYSIPPDSGGVGYSSNDNSVSGSSYSPVYTDTSQVDATQGGMYYNNQGFGGSQYNVGQGLVGAAAQCTFTSGLANFLKSMITHLIGSIIEETTSLTPIYIVSVPTLSWAEYQQAATTRAKEVCSLQIWGFCILPSLDSVAYCFINQIIDYIGKATVQWIKTGFQGSPAFVDDPGKFFENAVDSAAGTILNQITGGLLCEPWRAQVQLRLLNEHTGSFQQRAQGCPLSQVSDRWEDFTQGDHFDWGLQYGFTQNPYGNPLGSYIESRNAFNLQLANVHNGLQVQLGWGNGFLAVKDPETGRVTTPGRVIESQLNRRLGNAENRLLIADEFDEIINTLVNELVKLALSELFDSDDESESPDGQLMWEGGEPTGGGGGGEEPPAQEPETRDPDGGTDGVGSNLEVECVIADTTVLEGGTVSLSTTVSGQVGTVTYDWDGEYGGTGASATTSFAQEGSYRIEILASDQDWDGEIASDACPLVYVSEDYDVTCTVSDASIEPGDRVTYTAVVFGEDGEIVDYDWGGAASGQGASIEETYGSRGTYRVHVEVADEEGNRERAQCPDVVVARQ